MHVHSTDKISTLRSRPGFAVAWTSHIPHTYLNMLSKGAGRPESPAKRLTYLIIQNQNVKNNSTKKSFYSLQIRNDEQDELILPRLSEYRGIEALRQNEIYSKTFLVIFSPGTITGIPGG